MSDPGFYQITAFALGPGEYQILCAPFKSDDSISSSPRGLLKLSPNGLQTQILWGFIFPVQEAHAGEANMGLRTLTPVGKPLQYNYSPV